MKKLTHVSTVLAAGVVALATALVLTGGASAATSGLPSTATGVHAFHGLQGLSNTLTLSVAQQTAHDSDVVAATPGQLAKYASAMKAANPNVVLLAYVNGGYSKAGTAGSLPASEYLKNSSGGYITSTTWHNILMNPLSAGWQANVTSQCKAALDTNVSGCWLDQTSCAPLTGGFDTAQPVNPATRALYTKSAWAAAVGNELTAIQTSLGAPVYSNTYCSGVNYFSFPMSAANGAPSVGLEAEHWFTATSSNAHNLKMWQQGINMMIDAQAHGKVVTVSGNYPTTGTWPAYMTASYMLGNNGAALTTYDAPVSAALGAPTQTATTVAGYQQGQVYARSYQNGIVIVNPTGVTQTYAGHAVAAYSGYLGPA